MPTINRLLIDYFLNEDQFTLKEAYKLADDIELHVNKESIRARIYEGISSGIFARITKGVYQVVKGGNKCLLINGDGRDLSMIPDKSIDAIITDHPYSLVKSLKGGNRNLADYELFRYEQSDLNEKARVLKDGGFLVEFLPTESEANYEYLYQIKQMAKASGFRYYAKIPWTKGKFKANTGRTVKNSEDVMFFSKGSPRPLKPDHKANLKIGRENNIDSKGLSSFSLKEKFISNGIEPKYMSGTASILPSAFVFQPNLPSKRVVSAEKPVELLEELLEFITLPNETVLDQYAGSGNLGIAAINKNRNSILIEKNEETFVKMAEHIKLAI